MAERREGDRRRRLFVPRERTAQETRAADALDQLLDYLHGPERGAQLPGHPGNGTYRQEATRDH